MGKEPTRAPKKKIEVKFILKGELPGSPTYFKRWEVVTQNISVVTFFSFIFYFLN